VKLAGRRDLTLAVGWNSGSEQLTRPSSLFKIPVSILEYERNGPLNDPVFSEGRIRNPARFPLSILCRILKQWRCPSSLPCSVPILGTLG
jgi:hypothetical protein